MTSASVAGKVGFPTPGSPLKIGVIGERLLTIAVASAGGKSMTSEK
jgi:hypothetical protein